MKLKFNRNSELFFPDFGLFKPKQIVNIKDISIIKDMLTTGYFDKVTEKKKKIKIKKSKKQKRKEMF